MRKEFYTLLFAIAMSASIAIAQQPEVGVIYTMPQMVIAGGGGYSQWTQPDVHGRANVTVPNFEVEGTIGQAITGKTSGSPYNLQAGFWFADELQPTAAPASISGRINNLESVGILGRRVRVSITNLSTGEVRIQSINPFGYYEFADLELTTMYLIQAEGPSMVFEPASLTVRLVDNMTGVDFAVMPVH
jgi:hypothetical protein